jgi:pantoate--beta-alanine ligase
MLVIKDIKEIRDLSQSQRTRGNKIGLVPTMGALHSGHERLVSQSTAECDFTIVSVFVNPLQFNNQEDLERYPRDLNSDLNKLEILKVDAVFAPSTEAVYEDHPLTSLTFGTLESELEGSFRPGHFRGVGLVVAKLFNMVQPDLAFFGLKDLQQWMIIRQMVRDLSFPVEIVGIPTVRNASGLALSSRNQRLSEKGKEIAAHLYRGLALIEDDLRNKLKCELVVNKILHYYQNIDGLELEYAKLVDPETFLEIETYEGRNYVALCVAAYVEGIRLIDNLYLRLDNPE